MKYLGIKIRFTINLLSLIAGLSLALGANAQIMYVDDTLLVPLRSGEGTSFRIVHKGLRSGTKLEIIETLASGYAHVKTPGGIEGYLPARYLTSQPIAKVRLAQTEEKLAAVMSENNELKTQLTKLDTEHSKLTKDFKNTSSALDKNSKELSDIKSISANALKLDSRNRELRESNEHLRNELELLQTENLRLKDKSDSNMMMIGGALVVLGVILTLLIPVLRPSKKNDSWA